MGMQSFGFESLKPKEDSTAVRLLVKWSSLPWAIQTVSLVGAISIAIATFIFFVIVIGGSSVMLGQHVLDMLWG